MLFVQYVTDIRTVQKLLREAEEAIEFINKEEALYKMEQTHYPEVDVIKESIEPYQKLFGLVLRWQRTEQRSSSVMFLLNDANEQISKQVFLFLGGWMAPSRV